MIARLSGKLIEKKENALVIDVGGVYYEVWVPASVIERVSSMADEKGNTTLVTYHYFQISPGGGFPIMVGFLSELERDFFLQFIKISGIGPKAAIRAFNRPISEIASAIDIGDGEYLKKLPGIGSQRAKDIIAKLQGKVGRFALIQDKKNFSTPPSSPTTDFEGEALTILLQLQYKKQEAQDMIKKAFERARGIQTTEELLNEIYKQRMNV